MTTDVVATMVGGPSTGPVAVVVWSSVDAVAVMTDGGSTTIVDAGIVDSFELSILPRSF